MCERGFIMKKEYRIEMYNKDICPIDGEPFGWEQHGGKVYTDWVECANEYTYAAVKYPNNRFRIVWREVSAWEVCYS